MNLEQLRGFVEVARLGHFTRASEHLHLAQPSLSRQISTLERELGTELFHRARGHIALTAAGETLLPRAQRMLAEAEAIREEMDELAGLRRGRVRFGAPPTLCISLVAEAISVFHAAHPGVDLELTEAGSRTLVEQLAVGALDIALVTTAEGQAPTGALTRTSLLAEELVVISSAAQPAVTTGASIDLTQLAELPLVALDESYELRAITDAAFREAGLSPRPVLAGAEMDAVLRFVERGIGVAVVPAMVLLDRPALRSVRLAHPMMSRTISLAHRSDVTPAAAVAALRRVIVSTAAEVARRDPAITSLIA